MKDPLRYPKLRWPIDIRFEKIEQQQILVLSCPLGISPAPLGLVPAVAPIISCFEGQLSTSEIWQRFAEHGLKEHVVGELVTLLDKHLFLESPNFTSAEQLVRSQFATSPTRPAALAGLGYAAKAAELESELSSYLALAPAAIQSQTTKALLGLMAPHIDYHRGKAAYGAAYTQLRGANHTLYILMGTAHQYSPHLFHLTNKSFESPLGLLPTNQAFMQKLALEYGKDRALADEFLHKREHSLELQVPFLRYLNKGAEIAPILVGSFHHMLGSGRYPEQFEPYDAFVTALVASTRAALNQGASICFLAGVDMAHVGRSFGDKEDLSSNFMEAMEERDRIYLRHIERHDKHALFQHIAEDKDRRRICGFPTMYTLLDLLDRLGLRYGTQLFDYRQAIDYDRQCAVTFAGMGFYPTIIHPQ
ncbi:MAG: AmmeMemoRadiSam system protein B [Oligoflexia bacterium]|nr:AmmeMemoRadiSam system protein B [Oligoflexia bacterium]